MKNKYKSGKKIKNKNALSVYLALEFVKAHQDLFVEWLHRKEECESSEERNL